MMLEGTFTVKQIRMLHAELAARVQAASVTPLMRAGALVEREAKQSMRRGGGADGEPSTPGDPPNVQLGPLRASIAHAWDAIRRVVVAGSTEWYGKVHEYGGRNHPERPFMRPALVRVMDLFPALFRGIL